MDARRAIVVVPGARRGAPDRRLPARAGRADGAAGSASPRSSCSTTAATTRPTVVRRTAGELGLDVARFPGPADGAGAARRVGMDAACARLLDGGPAARPDRLHRRRLASGAGLARAPARSRRRRRGRDRRPDRARRARGGRARRADVLRGATRDAAIRLRAVRRADPDAAHHHFAGASLGVTAETYRAVGGIEPLAALEDAAFALRLAEHGVPILRAADVRVRTSARSGGRVDPGAVGRPGGLAVVRAAPLPGRGVRRRSGCALAKGDAVGHGDHPDQGVRRDDRRRAAPTRSARWREQGLVDELVVVDAGSRDGTAADRRTRRRAGDPAGRGRGRARAGAGQGRRDVARAAGHRRRHRLLPGRRHRRSAAPAICRACSARCSCDASVSLVKGAFDRPMDAGSGQAAPRGRTGHRADGPPAAQPPRAAAGRVRPAAGRRVRRRAGSCWRRSRSRSATASRSPC